MEKAKNKKVTHEDFQSGNYSRLNGTLMETEDGPVFVFKPWHKDVDLLMSKQRLVRRQFKDACSEFFIELCRNERYGYPCVTENIESIHIKHVYYPEPEDKYDVRHACEYLRSEYFPHHPYRHHPSDVADSEADEDKSVTNERDEE